MKKILALLLAMVMIFGLVACTASTATPEAPKEAAPAEASSQEEAPAAADGQEPVTLTVWYYEDPGMDVCYNTWAEDVHATYPWITLEFEALPYDSGPEKFTVACATGTTPDLYLDGFSRIAPACYSGLCLDVTDVVNENKSEFVAEIRDGVIDGKNYYLPTNSNATYGILVNMTLAEKLGVADMLPKDYNTWSYDEYLEVCRAAQAADPSIVVSDAFAGSRSSDAWYYSWFMNNGVELCNPELTATAFNDPEYRDKAIEVLNFFKQTIDEGMVPSGCATMKDEDMEADWCAGQKLFMHGAFNNMNTYTERMKEGTCVEFEFDCLGIPNSSGDGLKKLATWGNSGFAAFDNGTGHVEAIKLALGRYLQNKEAHSMVTNTRGIMSLLTDTEVLYGSEHLKEVGERGAEMTAKYAVSDFGILESWWTDFRDTLWPQLQDFFIGKIDAGTLLDNWQAAGDAVISAAK